MISLWTPLLAAALANEPPPADAPAEQAADAPAEQAAPTAPAPSATSLDPIVLDAWLDRLDQMSMHEVAYAYLIQQSLSTEDPTLRDSYELRAGMLLIEAKAWSQAITHFNALPLTPSTRLGLGWSLYQSGGPQPAMLILDESVPAEAYLEGWCALALRQPAAAIQAWENIPTGDPFWEPAQQSGAALEAAGRLPYRSPKLAGVMSAVVPGSGQAYTGNWGEAASAFLVNGALIAAGWQLAARDQWFGLGLVALLEVGFYGGNIVSAVGRAKRFNRLTWERSLSGIEAAYAPNLTMTESELSLTPQEATAPAQR